MTADLVAFLRARLDDDERIAAAVDSTPWLQGEHGSPEWDHHLVYVDDDVRIFHDLTEEEAAHVARHDPARVLAEVAAKRAILDRYERHEWWSSGSNEYVGGMDQAYEEVLRLLVQPYAGHPEFHPSWPTS